MPRSYLPPLLFRQSLILALLAGACSMRSLAVGAALLVMLILVPEREEGRGFAWRILKLLAAFLVGLTATFLAEADVPDKPSWASVPRQAVLVEGDIDSVTGLPGGRLRLLLKDLRQADMPEALSAEQAQKIRKGLDVPRYAYAESGKKSYAGGVFQEEKAALPGLAALTLDSRILLQHERPLPGQKMTALVRLYPSGGSLNAHESGPGRYWAAREVWHNARLVRSKDEAVYLNFSEGESWFYRVARTRDAWRKSMWDILANDCLESGNLASDAGNDSSGEIVPAFSQGKAMLLALLFGDRSELSLRTIDLFTRAGLVHSLALSGQHLALAAMLGVFSVMLLAHFKPHLFQTMPRRALIACAGLPFALCYLFLGGAPFSLVRAAFMMLAGAAFLCLRRPTAPLDAFLAAVLLLFLAWPLAVFDLSAQLSVLAVAGILLSMPLISVLRNGVDIHHTKPLVFRVAKKAVFAFASLLIVSFAAQAAVLPILISTFGAVSPCFWLNIIWLPPLTFLTLPLGACGLVLSVLGVSSLASLVFSVAAWPADQMIALLELLESADCLPFIQCLRPNPLSSLGYVVTLAALAFMVQARILQKPAGMPLKRLLAFGVFFLVGGFLPRWTEDGLARLEERVTLSMIDVGAGQAVLLEYPGGRLLVDGGGNTTPFFDCGRSIVAPTLTEVRLPYLDAAIVSHCDVDHARGLRWILEHFRVGALYWSPVSAQRADSGEGLALRTLVREKGIPEKLLKRGDTIALSDGVKLEVLSPAMEEGAPVLSEKELSSNNASLTLRLVGKRQGLALLCGDILSPTLKKLAVSGQDMKAEALVLPHHGAASSYQKSFYDAVSPKVALASCAPFNHYGFPSNKVREEMKRRAVPLLSTSELGTFNVQWKFKNGRYVMALPRP